ncbi:proliferating cell nuclear antigen [Ceratocystis lukuohia]|uniref:Vezatin n=1 Tax=Ceratocystis lukuohia TaxID=2019550 RepID=A0ABR4MAV7_9PEZI
MESVVYEETPLANYLREEGEADNFEWASPNSDSYSQSSHDGDLKPSDLPKEPTSPSSTHSSPQFAPTGRPQVRSQFRRKNTGQQLSLEIPNNKRSSLDRFKATYSEAVSAHIGRADNANFLEKFRYTIVASQLLSGHSILGQSIPYVPKLSSETALGPNNTAAYDDTLVKTSILPVIGAITIAFLIPWLASGGAGALSKRRIFLIALIITAAALISPVYFKQQYLKLRRDQALVEVSNFVTHAQSFDSASGAAIALIQEVELVSRGYRLSTPLPPISRIEDKSQTRKCNRLRKALKTSFMAVMDEYIQTSVVVKGFCEQLDLEKYYDIYDVSDLDMSDALQGFSSIDLEDGESLRVLKILAARFQTIRKMFLCSLLALDVKSESDDLLRWTTVVEALRTLNETTRNTFDRLSNILSDDEFLPMPATPKIPSTPGRERWRSQLRKLNSLSTGIRGLQAKLALLREESDHSLNESSDISELGPHLMSQYDSIGNDLKELITTWEEGKAALAQCIDRNEKRLSSVSGLMLLSPTSSLSGPTAYDDSSTTSGGRLDALRALTGESPAPLSSADLEQVFEAVAMPPSRPRSMFTREERIAKMKEERERRQSIRERTDANKGMLRELEMVINLRPRNRVSAPATSGPISPM